MSPEMLKTEIDRAEDAELQSDEQLRQLPSLIDKASTPSATLSASDCAKLVTAALAVNERLRERTSKLRISLSSALRSAPPTSGPES